MDRFDAAGGPGFSREEYETTLRQGINAAKDGRRGLARRLLLRATLERPGDPRPWIWMSATTDDLPEQREYLEKALLLEPTNEAARRGLLQLKAKLGEIAPLREADASQAAAPVPASVVGEVAQTFTCPQCGGRTRFDNIQQDLVCEYCGHTLTTEERTLGGLGQVSFHLAMHTQAAHAWAASQLELKCKRCGALTLLPPETQTAQCPYCGSNQLVRPEDASERRDPEGIVLFKVDAAQAAEQARHWLEQGWLTPDDIKAQARRLELRPAYLPFWEFDGYLGVPWTCEVLVRGMVRGQEYWEPRSGEYTELFKDILTPGSRALPWRTAARVEPFNLADTVAFTPEHVAGWPALTYDRSLADASLDARERVMRGVRSKVPGLIEIGSEKRNINLGVPNWADVNYRYLLLPFLMGSYTYKGEEYSLIVNGQTGKIWGAKPQDRVKLYTWAAILAVGLLSVGLILYLLLGLS